MLKRKKDSNSSAHSNGGGVMIDLIGLFKSVRAKKARINSHILKAGFTLIEMSIVLVIIGLLVGGILTGQSIIRSSELLTITTQKEAFASSVSNFKTKYNSIPGDTTRARDLWGGAADCSVAQTTAATCNGNGNGLIDNTTPSGTIGNEVFLFWKHLSNLGVVSGNFTGITDGSTGWTSTTKNSPSGKMTGSLWYASSWGTLTGYAWAFDGVYNNVFQFGLPITDAEPALPIITPREMYAIDKKIDDGKPGTGNLRARTYNTNCAVKTLGGATAVSSDASTAVYNTNSGATLCSLVFSDAF